MTCTFCKVLESKEAALIYESKHSLSFLDKYPLAEGHALVIPKKHYAAMHELPEEELCDLITHASRVQRKLLETIKPQGIDMRLNYRPYLPEGKLTVHHVHIHLVPRWKNDALFLKALSKETPLRREPSMEELKKTSEKIAAKLR